MREKKSQFHLNILKKKDFEQRLCVYYAVRYNAFFPVYFYRVFHK